MMSKMDAMSGDSMKSGNSMKSDDKMKDDKMMKHDDMGVGMMHMQVSSMKMKSEQCDMSKMMK